MSQKSHTRWRVNAWPAGGTGKVLTAYYGRDESAANLAFDKTSAEFPHMAVTLVKETSERVKARLA